MPTVRVLVVDDYEPFRRVVRLILELRDDLQIVGEASDGLEAVQKAKRLTPDLILLDLDLPTLSGIQVARRVSDLIPRAKILFVSVESSPDVVREALNAGGAGYISKLHIGSELLSGIEAVLTGKQFLGSGLEVAPRPQRHEMVVYSEDAILLEKLNDFVAGALRTNNAAIVVVTNSHREGLVRKLEENGFNVDDAIRRGVFICLDAAEMLSKVLVGGVPDRSLFLDGFRSLIESAAKAARSEHPRVAIFGDCCGLLYAEGNLDAAISIERMGNDLCKSHNIDILCSYHLLPRQKPDPGFDNICAEHSAVYSN